MVSLVSTFTRRRISRVLQPIQTSTSLTIPARGPLAETDPAQDGQDDDETGEGTDDEHTADRGHCCIEPAHHRLDGRGRRCGRFALTDSGAPVRFAPTIVVGRAARTVSVLR